jgi:predicted ribosomally synthesized peptide with SipW-like signal peptide
VSWPKISFVCSSCGASFRSAGELRAHDARLCGYLADGRRLVADGPAVAFACAACGSAFAGVSELREHAERCASDDTKSHPPHVAEPVNTASLSFVPAVSSERRRPPAPPLARTSVRAATGDRHPRRRITTTRVAVIAAAAVLLMIVSTPVLAWFTASAKVPARVTTGVWTNGLVLTPGCSRAVHVSGGCSRSLPIATRGADGGLSLDFGDVKAPGATWTDVFRITSTAPAKVTVWFVTSGAIAPLVSSVRFSDAGSAGALAPSQTRKVAVVLSVTSKTAPGEYRGTLTVGVSGSTETHTLPMLVTVIRACSPSPSPSVKPSPSHTPSCSPSPSTSPSCSPSPSTSPAAAALYTLGAGLSTVLPHPGATSPPATVAQTQPDKTLLLSFGTVPTGQKLCFSDVLRVAGKVRTRTVVTFSFEAASGDLFARVGLWDAPHHRFRDDTVLGLGVTDSIAVEFRAPLSAMPGVRSACLVVTAVASDGRRQQTRLPLTVDFQRTSPSTSPSSCPSPSSSPSKSPSGEPKLPTPPATSASHSAWPVAGIPAMRAHLSLSDILALPLLAVG